MHSNKKFFVWTNIWTILLVIFQTISPVLLALAVEIKSARAEGIAEITDNVTPAVTATPSPTAAAATPPPQVEEPTSTQAPEPQASTTCTSQKQGLLEVAETEWIIDSSSGTAETKSPVQLGYTYIFPLNNDVRITFTCLPSVSAARSTLKIQQIAAADIRLPEGTNAASEYGYDITTSMANGTFNYDLQLPKSSTSDAQVSYIEKDPADIKGKQLSNNDVKKFDQATISQNSDTVKVSDVDHFTIVIATYESNFSTSKASYTQGETVYAKADNLEKSQNIYYRIDILNPSGTSVSNSGCSKNKSSFSYNYSTTTSSLTGNWSAKITKYNGSSDCDANTNVQDTGIVNFSLTALPTVTPSPTSTTLGGTTNVTNPTLAQACGLDIALVLDVSSSISSTELAQMKSAFISFVNALAGTPTRFSVTEFSTTASVVQNFTADLNAVKTAINNVPSGGYTNWQDGFVKSYSTYDPRADKPNLLIFSSDGNPNRTGTFGTSVPESQAVADAAVVANSIKTAGTRILALGIGSDLNTTNMIAISGSNVNTGNVLTSDVISTNFPTLATQLATFASQTCGGTISVNKYVDNVQQSAGQTWSFLIDGTTPLTTDADGQGVSGTLSVGTHKIAETSIPSGYTFDHATCSNGTSDNPNKTVKDISITADSIITCDFYNTTNPGSITIIKDAQPNNAQDFAFTTTGSGLSSFSLDDDSDATLSNTKTFNSVMPGTYTITESSTSGWTLSNIVCSSGGAVDLANRKATITMTPGANVTCTYTNTINTGHLIVQKTTYPASDPTVFSITASGTGTITGGGSGTVTDSSDKDYEVTPGTYSVTESVPGNWVQTGNTCNNVVVAGGATVYCQISNTKNATLIVKKDVINDNGGTLTPANFTMNVTGSNATPASFAGSASGTSVSLAPGSYSVDENSVGGYAKTLGANCSGTIAAGETKTCTITNNDISPQLKVIKHVINDSDGTLTAANFTMSVTGSNVLPASSFAGSESGTTVTLNAGSYSVSETGGTSLYTATNSANCSGTIALGETKICTITNDDIDFKPAISVTKTANVSSIDEPGGNVTYTFTVTNNSTHDAVTITALSDDKFGTLAGDIDCHVGSVIAIAGSCSFNAIFNISGDANTTHHNTFSATVRDEEGNQANATASADVAFKDVKPALSVSKTPDKSSVKETGETVVFTFKVTNTSPNEAITIKSLTDSVYSTLAGDADCQIGTVLAAGASCEFTLSKLVSGNASGPSHTNTFTAVAEDNEHNNVDASATATVRFNNVAPTLEVDKSVTPDNLPESGGIATYTFKVKNTSAEKVTITSLSDDKFGVLSGDASCQNGTELAAGASCQFSINKSLAGNAGTTHINTFTAYAVDDDATSVHASDNATVTFTNVNPAIQVSKTANTSTVPETGGNVTYTYTVKNISAVDYVTITALGDDKFPAVTGDADCHIGTVLAPNASCDFSYTASLSGNSGTTHTNTITVTAKDDENTPVTESASRTITFTDVKPAISVTKTTNTASVNETGENVLFTFTVKNENSVEAVVITSLNDNIFGALTGDADCQIGTLLAGGASCTFQMTKWIEGDASGPAHTNTFNAIAKDDENNSASNNATATVSFKNVLPTIEVVKTAGVATIAEPGGNVTYTFTVKNTSAKEAVTITNLQDNKFGALSGDADCQVGTILAAGASCQFSAIKAISGDANATHTNTFKAYAVDNEQSSVWAEASATVTFTDVKPTIQVTKTANPLMVPETGGNVTYTFTVKNTDTAESVKIKSLSDDKFGALVGDSDCNVGTILAPNATCTFNATFPVSGEAGTSHTNTFTATAEDNEFNQASANASATVSFTDVKPSVLVTKISNKSSVAETGENVQFTFMVKNTSDKEAITIDSLNDSVYGTLAGDADCHVGTILAAGASCDFTLSKWVIGNASGPSHTNTFTAVASDNEHNSVNSSATATIRFTDVAPSIAVSKNASVTDIPETSGSVTYTYTITNFSVVDSVTITALSDDKFPAVTGDADCHIGTVLAPDASCSFTYTTTLSGDAGTTHANTFSVVAEDDEHTPASDSDTATIHFTDVKPVISVTKTANKSSVWETGENVTFTFVVKNDSKEAVIITGLQDNVFGTLSGSINCKTGTILAAGASCSFQYNKTISGDFSGPAHQNNFTATAKDNENNSVNASDSETINFNNVLPDITLVKTANPTTLPEPGGNVTFQITVNNLTKESVNLTSLSDDVYGNLNGVGSCTLPQTISGEGNYSCQFDKNVGILPGTYTDIATATAYDNDDSPPDTASDDASVVLTYVPTLKLVKNVINDNGGTATAADWTLSASGDKFGFSDSGDSTTFHEVAPGAGYTLSESTVNGYQSTGWSCDGGSFENGVITLRAEDDVTCTATNDDIGGIITVVKYNDFNGNGQFDTADEDAMPGWTITTDNTTVVLSKVTDSEGQAEFTDLYTGLYTISEGTQTGWELTNIGCYTNPIGEFEPTQISEEGATVKVLLGSHWYCYVGNKYTVLTINKTNTAPNPLRVGNTFSYIITIKNPDCNLTGNGQYCEDQQFDTAEITRLQTVDTFPKGFKYITGSYKATLHKHDGSTIDITPYVQSEPLYTPVGTWNIALGDSIIFEGGDRIVLEYQAQMINNLSTGAYRDTVYARTWNPEVVLASLAYRSLQLPDDPIFALDENSSAPNDYFAGTVVYVAQDLTSDPVEIKSSELPATGSGMVVIIMLAGIAGLGAVLIIMSSFMKPKNGKTLKAVCILLATPLLFSIASFIGTLQVSAATTDLNLEVADIGTNTASGWVSSNTAFDISYVGLDTTNTDIDVACSFKRATESDAAYQNIGSTNTLSAPGGSGICTVNSGTIVLDNSNDANNYFNFKVTASSNGNTVYVVKDVYINQGNPKTPVSYAKTVIDDCNDNITFTTSSDSGANKTVAVNVYRSTLTSFIADDTSVIDKINIGPGETHSATYTVPDCGKTYYYVVQALDIYGNRSDYIGDQIVIIITATPRPTSITGPTSVVTATPSVTGSVTPSGVVTSVTPTGSVAGASTIPSISQVLGVSTTDNTQGGGVSPGLLALLIIAGLGILGGLGYAFIKKK